MKRRIGSLLTALVLGLSMTLAVATPASASISDCPFGTGCYWVATNYSGPPTVLAVGVYGYNRCQSYIFTPNVRSASVTYGSAVKRLSFYVNNNCTGSSLRVVKGSPLPNVNFAWLSFRIETV